MDNFIEFLYSRFLLSDGVSIDTRTVRTGDLFFGIKGPNFNGSAYAEEALSKGANYAVIDDPTYQSDDKRLIYCENAQQALQELSVFHRSKFFRPVIGLTGSNGKTTTKELVAAILAKKYIIHATQGNLNNHLGVPLTILGIYPQVEIAIIEMGANHVGDIAELCQYANPTIGLITNIGHAHTELFGGIEGVLRGKTELFDHLRDNKGLPFINLEDNRLKHLTARFEEPVTFPGTDVKLLDEGSLVSVQIGALTASTQLFGSYNYGNIAAAIALGRYFEVADHLIVEALEQYVPDNMRSQVIEENNVTLIMDAYNANPDSMLVALENLTKQDGKKLAIVGDMYEIENQEDAHKHIGDWLNKNHMEAVFVGERMKSAMIAYPAATYCQTLEEAKEYLKSVDLTGYHVLLKASRSVKLEQLKESILQHS
jgi:UDP-N-acetylmuramoyl-tripeptide--D-alanyl-D-alanine ligase